MLTDIKISAENLLNFGSFEDWNENGTSDAPTDWDLSGSSATAAQEATIVKKGTYSLKLTRAGFNAIVGHNLPQYVNYLGRKMTFGCWVYATVADRARISIADGVGTSNSSYHTGDSTWQFLSVTRNISPTATSITPQMRVNDGNTTAYFDGAILCEGDKAFVTITDYADVSGWTPANTFRGQQFQIARRPGVKVPRMVLSSKSLSIKGKVVSNDQTTTRDNWDALNRVLLSFRDKADGYQEARDLYLFDDRFLRGHLNDHDGEYLGGSIKITDFEWKFICPDPFFYSSQKKRVKQTLSSSPITFTVTNNGNAFTRPIIRIEAPSGSALTSVTIENLTSGQSVAYAASIAASDSLVIDTDVMTVENDGADDIGSVTGDTELLLLPGGNEIRVTSSATGGIARIDFWERWF